MKGIAKEEESSNFFLITNMNTLQSFPLANFLWKSKASLKVKAFVWLVATIKVNSNDLLQKRTHKSLR